MSWLGEVVPKIIEETWGKLKGCGGRGRHVTQAGEGTIANILMHKW